jgi:hypothetical protein
MPTVLSPGDFYLVASFRPPSFALPPEETGMWGPVPPQIKVANTVCVIQASSEEAAIKLLRDWDQQPPGTQYFAVPLEHVEPAAQTLPAP